MLVLTRGRAQTLLIGDRVTLTVLDIRGNQVRLGITVPDDIRVRRVENRRVEKAARPSTTVRVRNSWR